MQTIRSHSNCIVSSLTKLSRATARNVASGKDEPAQYRISKR